MNVPSKGPSFGKLDDYANSMFRFERLHDDWIDRCALYLRHVFGSRVEGATVIDYAFGRGNWSIAFLRAGAARVVAIDASTGNVERFASFVTENAISGVEVVHGNIVESSIDETADLLWIYGVLHHIPDTTKFLAELRQMANEGAAAYFYAYDADSLRETVVEACRRWAFCGSESEFRVDSLFYTPVARRRVQDDLTAPHVGWYTVHGLATELADHGFFAKRRDSDFGAFERGCADEEFQPHQLFCELGGEVARLAEPDRAHAADVDLVRSMIETAFRVTAEDARKRLAIGLANTHFTAAAAGDFEHLLREDFLYLVHAVVLADAIEGLPGECAAAVELALAAVADGERAKLGRDDRSIDRFLRCHTVRI